MAKKITFEKWVVMVNRNDGISYEKLEPYFIPDHIGGDVSQKQIERHDEDGKIIRTLDPDFEIQLTQEEADKLNEESQSNGIRYYAKG